MKEEHRDILLIQLAYVFTALLVALILWLILPESSQAKISTHEYEFSGAFAGFLTVWLLLRRAGLLEEMIQTARQPVRAGIILTPSKKEEYNALFDSFENCDFYAFNPPFELEGEPGEHLFQEAVSTHEKRYLEGGVKSRYLLFGQKRYDRAKTFFQRLENRLGKEKMEECIKILHWKNPLEVPGYTFFIGYKGKEKPFCIFYPSAAMRGGLPEAVIYIEGAKDFLSILKGHFQEGWDKAKQEVG